ncbi:hypothetical protein CAP40_01540 [Sphingomonas sp. IBVSS2]|nr:hypothetical protein CAP40_01540 [Sphingomonas sp. IBVSS2]
MLSDIFRRLAHFEPVENYRYVGFGSVWFSDFILFHRALGVRDMLSIEKSVASKDRFEANKPFHIEMDFRPSSEALPDLDYSRRQFIWLDYDETITPSMLQDVTTVASRARSGTVLVVSVQCKVAPDVVEADRDREQDPQALNEVERFRQRIGADRVAADIDRVDLGGWPFGDLSRSIFREEINRALETRRLAHPETAVSYRRICDFEYEDGAKMTTFAVVFYSEDEETSVDSCMFDGLEFLRPDNDPVRIPTPKLTIKEFRHLESQLPLPNGAALDIGYIPEGEAKGFSSMYRYLPNFAVIES